MPLKIYFLSLFCVLFTLESHAQYRYLIEFKDKNNSPYSIERPLEFLSQKAVDRRTKNSISITQDDLPVNPAYLEAIKNLEVKIVYPLKWVNGAVILANQEKLNQVLNLNQVKGLMFPFPLDSLPIQGNTFLEPKKKETPNRKELNQLAYGSSESFIKQLKLDSMHTEGFTGKGILVGILDGGFYQLNENSGLLQNLNDKILDTLTTYPGFHSFYDIPENHGKNVFSIMGTYSPNRYIGGLFDSKFVLAQTEEGFHEVAIEEINWMRGAEWADSLGVDLINTSLGYSNFDNPIYSHTYQDMDGQSTFISRAVNIAASKGIICVTSAGNSGNNSWKYINAPADAQGSLTVGATTSQNTKAGFSSFGPTADGRIKPDIAALGQGIYFLRDANAIDQGNGTSFSSPAVACLVGGLIQAFPKTNYRDIIEAIRLSGSLNKEPNYELGYGIPNWVDASKILRSKLILSTQQEPSKLKIFPNPLTNPKILTIEKEVIESGIIEIFNLEGKSQLRKGFSEFSLKINLERLPAGKYLVYFQTEQNRQILPLIVN